MEVSIQRYLSEAVPADIQTHGDTLSSYLKQLEERMDDWLPSAVSTEAMQRLLFYRVPALTSDGCSRIDGTLDEAAYDLGQALGLISDDLESHPAVRRLKQIDSLLEAVFGETKVDWLGVYLAWKTSDTSDVLIKIAYRGVESRAEFPLTREFARQSNNSSVGLSGKAVVINDIEHYLWQQGGPYYQCDSKVLSEACLPIFAPDESKVLGIVDAEAWSRNVFSPEIIAKLSAFCLVLESALDKLTAELKPNRG